MRHLFISALEASDVQFAQWRAAIGSVRIWIVWRYIALHVETGDTSADKRVICFPFRQGIWSKIRSVDKFIF